MRYSVDESVDDFPMTAVFLLHANKQSLAVIWDNPDDDIYAELLECDVDPVKP